MLDVATSARVCEITTPADLANLSAAWPDEDAIADPPHAPGGHCGVDWIGVASAFDGVRLTRAGVEKLAVGLAFIEEEQNLCGWDCESTLWFRWAFDGVREVDVEELLTQLR